MECPFCAETIRNEAIVCRHCSRDLRVSKPILNEIEEIVAEIERLTRDLGRFSSALERGENPFRYFGTRAVTYIMLPSALLVLAHILVTIVLDIQPLSLRLASVAIPLLFGFLSFPLSRTRFPEAMALAILAALVSVSSMLTVTGLHDDVPILPQTAVEWREVLEYGASIMLAYISGNLLGTFVFAVFPLVLSQRGKPNAIAFRMARWLGGHAGDDQLRRRARVIQDLLRTVGPLIGVVVTAIGSLYTGLKGILG
jgi:hypothetical protein